ncbi:uncharacterized protein GVI51_D06303 [Nakaseomyces glabratus]|nr:Eukaryotic translation initiation factor 4G1 [Nakaseomyces glabratus]KAH7596770.1 Eukaryotic translation initiation factor 4G1 [Nakaseomyces glabratus]KAH7606627.1 Eukaryotic translation initiation factor 4G1 [Nakaseomyces glabratus]KAH7608131.1 Eukaryotic translation initiation factor 4G1 [Nakaseomyces glabratus]KAH7608537.1 Eukaryotic translation initiation factor 4G1 [Nakaseomyces glabratus]
MTEQEANAIKNEGSNDSIQTTKMQNENPEPSKEDNTNTSYTNGNDKVNNGGNNYNNYNNYNNRNSYHSNNYSRNYQQRNTGGRYNNPNKFNNGGTRVNSKNVNQQNNYNNYNASGTNRYMNNYNKHNRNQKGTPGINPAAAMQWAGYYGNQMYYFPQGMAAMGNPAGMDMAAMMAAQQGMMTSPQPGVTASETPSPPPIKIEITKKTGEHLDLDEIRAQHKAAAANKEKSPSASIENDVADKKESEKEGSSIVESKDEEKDKQEVNATKPEPEQKEDASEVRRLFLEQVKLRKAAIEKAKRGESTEASEASDSTDKAVGNNEPSTDESDSNNKDAENSEDQDTFFDSKDTITEKDNELESGSKDSSPRPLTFAEKLKLKKKQTEEHKEEDSNKEEHEQVNIDTTENSGDNNQHVNEVELESKEKNESDVPIIKKVTLEEPIKDTTETVEGVTNDEENVTGPLAKQPADILTMTEFLAKLKEVEPVDDIYTFTYPPEFEEPDPKYKKQTVKYTYGPSFLLQFKEKARAFPDDPWQLSTAAKIVIPPSISKSKSRDSNRFNNGPSGRMGEFRNGSMRNMDMRSGSKVSSKRKSKRMDDRKSTRTSYTSRKDRERMAEENRRDEPKVEVAPLVPSANRWVPKSKQKKETEKKLAPDGTELLDKEEIERKMKSLLNKLTLEKFEPISNDILAMGNQSKWETEGETLKLVIEQIFLKACDEPHWSSMYAQLCGKIVKELDASIYDNTNEGKTGPKLVLHYLVARCHTEFEKGWTDKLPTKEDGSPLEPEMMSDEYYQAAAAKRRGLGLVRFIGFLYRLNLLTGKMMFECFRRLMRDLTGNPSEEILESVVELLETVGEQFETDSFRTANATLEGSALLDSLFQILQSIINEGKISSRIKFKLIDVKELRELKHWNSSKKDAGPKTIQQIHEEEERQRMLKSNSRQSSRRVNNNSMGNHNNRDRGFYRRENTMNSRDNFQSTRSPSTRYNSKDTKEDQAPAPKTTNMFSALMDTDEEE